MKMASEACTVSSWATTTHRQAYMQQTVQQNNPSHTSPYPPGLCCWVERVCGYEQHPVHPLSKALQSGLCLCPRAQVAQQHDKGGQALLAVNDLCAQ